VPAAKPQQLHIRVLPHIRRALEAGKAVVALESSVLAQGLPIPANGEAARRMIDGVHSAGATAAITAIVCGTPTVGLDEHELSRFLSHEGIRKVSARDIGPTIAQRADGATTVAAALAIASRSGIRTLATGGIGGVHRGRGPRDESADLMELGRTPMIVVCAGAKSILDLPSTWERLDTLGVPVVGFGTDEFPGFFTAQTGIRLSVTASSAAEAARIASAHFAFGRMQAVLVAQPPPEHSALDATVVENAVKRAVQRAERDGVRGAAVTPFLLEAVSRETDGRALETNLALLESNARLAAQIALHL
jgi:pseudouridylate synthase